MSSGCVLGSVELALADSGWRCSVGRMLELELELGTRPLAQGCPLSSSSEVLASPFAEY